MKRLLCSVVVAALALTLAACGGLAGEPAIVATLASTAIPVVREISLPQNAPDFAVGAQVYAANCTRCHGAGGAGDGELVKAGQVTGVPDFTSPQTALNDAPIAWFEVVTNGRLDKLMPPWGDKLSDDERWSVTLYVYTLANSAEQIAQGKAVWADKCADCHGENGEGTAKGAPLPNLLNVSSADALAALVNGIPDKMPSFADDLTAEQRAAALAYARTLNSSGQPVEVAQAPTQGAVVSPNATEEAASTSPTAVRPTSGTPTREAAAPNATEAVLSPNGTPEVGAPTNGTVSGRVTNGTEGAGIPTEIALNLHVISGTDQSSAQTFTGTTNADGSFTFSDVPFMAGSQYVVSTSYENAVFSSDVVAGDPANPQLDLPLTIYEVTDDPASISINGALMMLQPDTSPGRLGVVQIVSFSNTSDHVFVRSGGDSTPTSVVVNLPAGAAYEDFSGGAYVLSADGTQVSDTSVVLPGDSHVMHIGYTVPYSGTTSVAQTVDYPFNGSLEIMVPSGGLSISGSGISTLGTRQMGTQAYTSFGGTFAYTAGQAIQFQINGATSTTQTTTAPANGISTIAYVLIGVGLLAIGAAFGFFMRERTGGASAPAAAPASAEINALVKQIADLDVQYQQGKIAEGKYRAQRKALKARLTEQMKAAAEQSDGE